MGIRGLSSYFSNRDSFFKTISLDGGVVIIDGNNLRYSLYRDTPGTNHAFTGEYDKYYKHVHEYFSTLVSCGITPIVVFDGGYDVSDIKQRTVMHRARDQIRNSLACNSVSQHKIQVYPLLGKSVYLDVLADLNIQCVQTLFEADQIIARMGMERGCPVLSNDSDFFVFSVDFVKLDSVDIIRSKEEGKLVCDIFDRNKFLDYYNFSNPDLLHLLASLIGNDYIPPSVFDVIFSTIKLPNKTKSGTERHRKIRGLISWLSKESNVNSAIDRILGAFQEKDRKSLKTKILASMDVYSGGDDGQQDQNILPQRLQKDFFECRLPNWTMDVVARNRFLLPPQVECGDKPSAHTITLPIMRTIIQIINAAEKPITIQGRTKHSVGTIFTLEDPHLDISDMSGEEKKSLFLESLGWKLGSSALDLIPDELLGLFLVLQFWSKHGLVTPAHVYSILLARSIVLDVDPAIDSLRNEKKIKQQLENPQTPSNKKPYLKTISRYAPFFHVDETLKSSIRKFDRELVHSLAVFQAVFYSSTVLAALLNNPVIIPKISNFFSGTFVYNMTTSINKKPETLKECFLPEEARRNFVATFQLFVDNLPNLGEITSPRKQKKKKVAKVVEKKVELSDGVDSDLTQSETENVFVDLENRFSALIVAS